MRPDDLLARVHALAVRGPRVVLGIAGCPGAGKSTLAEWLVDRLTATGLPAVWVPMDGFHLADVELERLGRRDRKGAIDTFDAAGYLALLRRLHAETATTVYAPAFDRELEQPVAGAIPVPPDTRVVVTEGNYLLVPDGAWRQLRGALTEAWFVDADEDLRRERLVARHVRFGKAPDAARAWVAAVDEPNARLIAATRGAADLVVDLAAVDLSTEPAEGPGGRPADGRRGAE